MPNSLLPDRLEFDGTELTVVDYKGRPCLGAVDLSRALGYKHSDSVTKIYNRNADEFTSDMTETVKLTASGNLQKTTRIFSPRGCHLVAMFAKTPKAKAFRKWVLDVLDHITDSASPEHTPINFSNEALAVWNPCTGTADFNAHYFLSSHFDRIRLMPKLLAVLQQNGMEVSGAITEYNALCECFSNCFQDWQAALCRIEASVTVAKINLMKSGSAGVGT